MDFTNRQIEIIEILRKHEPITAEQISDMLGVSKATIRSDLAVLVMTGNLEAKPKVGYFLGKAATEDGVNVSRLQQMKVKDVMGLPIVIPEKTTINDAVVTLFIENVGTLMVIDEDGFLEGIVSRKDLLKMTLGNANASTMPVNMVMTRQPNIITITEEDSVVDAARNLIHYEFDSLPVVRNDEKDQKKLVVGRITKTTMTKVLLEVATNSPSTKGVT